MTMLETLAIMTNAAREVKRKLRDNAFGHLLVLLRDVPDQSADVSDARSLFFECRPLQSYDKVESHPPTPDFGIGRYSLRNEHVPT